MATIAVAILSDYNGGGTHLHARYLGNFAVGLGEKMPANARVKMKAAALRLKHS